MTQNTSVDSGGTAVSIPLSNDPKRLGQLIFGGLFLLIFIGYFLMARDMPPGTLESPGPGLFPTWIGVGGIVISGIVIVESLMKRGESGNIGFPKGTDLKVALIFSGTIVGYILVLPYLGMMASSILYAITFLKFGSTTSWLRSVIVGGLMGAVLTLFFSSVLGLPLPQGVVF